MEWTEEVTLNFIEMYRTKDILWDTKHPRYYNKVKKNDAWEEIAKEMSTSVDECKKKMNALQSALRWEKAKMKKSQGTGTGRDDLYASSWFAFKSLLFLWDKNKVRDTQSTIETERDEDVEDDTRHATQESERTSETREFEDTQEIRENQNDISVENTQGNNSCRVTVPRTRKRKCPSDDQKLDAAFQILTKASSATQRRQELNEYQIFGNLVAKKLQKYSNVAQTAVQEAIMNILFQADRGYYDQRNASQSSHVPQHHSYPSSAFYNLQYATGPQHRGIAQRFHSTHSQVYQNSPLTSSSSHDSGMSNNYSTCAPQSQTTRSELASPAPSHNSISSNYSAADSIPPPSPSTLTQNFELTDMDFTS